MATGLGLASATSLELAGSGDLRPGENNVFQAFGLKVLFGLTLGKVTIEDKRKKENK